MLGLHPDLVKLLPYDPEWKIEGEKEVARLKNLLGDRALGIEHVGSTAIPGISAKPIIDIAVGVKSVDELEPLIDVFTKAGYDVRNSIAEKGEILARKGSSECRTHYVHVEPYGGEYWLNHTLFKRFMLDHPEYVKPYEDMKQEMFSKYADNRIEYTAHKNDFIKEIINKAKQEYLH